ncbi:GNAT family N-acetyltransferase [Burkholderia sp. Ac-20345]|uniref:GNAT family N-acetyltransferase n=1 Tax=Burkholderia sp. Ac-20345 TaxID=2703891 RepID=UPI00197BFBF8|nr:GNAT family N-acetyltransferase [Burkholderia sp. Ac-20345]MBN3784525.1 GNAT family N-acetyltransferase [Burkholderia sp. Ac-20345]
MNVTTVRLATTDDAAIAARILTDAVALKTAHDDTAWGHRARTEQDVRPMLDDGSLHIVEQDGIAAAMFVLTWDDEAYWGPQAPVAGYLHRLSVRDGFHGRGLGRHAVDWCADQVRAQQRALLRLDCDPRNVKLCAYYEALGFERVALRPLPSGYIASLYERAVAG